MDMAHARRGRNDRIVHAEISTLVRLRCQKGQVCRPARGHHRGGRGPHRRRDDAEAEQLELEQHLASFPVFLVRQVCDS